MTRDHKAIARMRMQHHIHRALDAADDAAIDLRQIDVLIDSGGFRHSDAEHVLALLAASTVQINQALLHVPGSRLEEVE